MTLWLNDRVNLTREILRLAVPAFGALIAEPLFLLVDTAVVGHLGTTSLAGLGVASGILLTIVGVFVFLAYGTTSVVARKIGAGDERGALEDGIDGIWLSLILGALTCAITMVISPQLIGVFGASPAVTSEGAKYLAISALGIAPMLAVLAATGVLRGLLDTVTPLVVTSVGFTVNAALSVLFVHPLGFGIAGAAWATVIAQTGMGIALLAVVIRHARQRQARLNFNPTGVLQAGLGGIPLLVRTLALRSVLLLTTWAAANFGDGPLAAHQVAMTIWSALAFALDALAIAAQSLTGRDIGAGNFTHARALMNTLLKWGLGYGAILATGIIVLHRILPLAFTSDVEVQAILAVVLIIVALGQPIASVAYVLDGVLIGAGDARWLARAQLGLLIAYLPLVIFVRLDPDSQLTWLWIAYNVFMTMRAGILFWRSRQDAWLRN